mmetsp:Transcript_3700/g.15367  ORF Transcript_3700/g.15367 Transcript_3700/m.15367 type:complete len:207 (+) Transcript_3700:6282-6902(+)
MARPSPPWPRRSLRAVSRAQGARMRGPRCEAPPAWSPRGRRSSSKRPARHWPARRPQRRPPTRPPLRRPHSWRPRIRLPIAQVLLRLSRPESPPGATQRRPREMTQPPSANARQRLRLHRGQRLRQAPWPRRPQTRSSSSAAQPRRYRPRGSCPQRGASRSPSPGHLEARPTRTGTRPLERRRRPLRRPWRGHSRPLPFGPGAARR